MQLRTEGRSFGSTPKALTFAFISSGPTTKPETTDNNSAEAKRPWLSLVEMLQETPKKLETGLRTTSAGIPYTLLLFLRVEDGGFPTFGRLLCLTVAYTTPSNSHSRA